MISIVSAVAGSGNSKDAIRIIFFTKSYRDFPLLDLRAPLPLSLNFFMLAIKLLLLGFGYRRHSVVKNIPR